VKEHTTYWIARFKKSEKLGHLRFKKLRSGFRGYPPFDIDESLIEDVDLEEFLNSEEDKIPFFVGTQFGVTPDMDSIPGFYDVDRKIAILAKSALSGNVAGLRIYFIPKGSRFNDRHYSFYNELLGDFKNEKL
jgi:hypothetical protein